MANTKAKSTPNSGAALTAALVHALRHPVRVQILEYLTRDSGSATTISTSLGLDLGVVSYHLNQVLDRQCHLLTVVEERRVRGASELFYRPNVAAIRAGIVWPEVPEPLRTGLKGAAIHTFINCAVAALESGSMAAREDTTITWRPIDVDEIGWTEVRTALNLANKAIDRACRATASRKAQQDPIHVLVGLAAFEAPPADLKDRAS